MCEIGNKIEDKTATGYKLLVKNLDTGKYYSPSFLNVEVKVGDVPVLTEVQLDRYTKLSYTRFDSLFGPSINTTYNGFTSVSPSIDLDMVDLLYDSLNRWYIKSNISNDNRHLIIPVKVTISKSLHISYCLWGDDWRDGIAGRHIDKITEIIPTIDNSRYFHGYSNGCKCKFVNIAELSRYISKIKLDEFWNPETKSYEKS